MSHGYETIDPAIDAWVERHSFTLFTQVDGSTNQFRCVYLSSSSGECCQIWIDLPANDLVSRHAREIESRHDEEMRMDWIAPIAGLGDTLDRAVVQVRQWFRRAPIK
jgi:hypothetical protein